MRRAPVLLLLLLAAACASPIGVSREDAHAVHRELTANAISTGRPSDASLHLLDQLDLTARWREEPDAVLAELHAGLAPSGDVARLFALAELSFVRSEDEHGRDHALAAAVYAWALLFPPPGTPALDPLDPRLQAARHLYNRGLTLGLESAEPGEVTLAGGRYALPFGELEIAYDPDAGLWAGHRLEHFRPAAEFKIRGLRNRYRRPGLGAPLAADLGAPVGEPPPGSDLVPLRLKVPATAFLRIEDARAGIAAGRLRATLELSPVDRGLTIEVGGARVPLERETTSWLAYTLEGSPVWDFELAGFRSGDFLPGGVEPRLWVLRPPSSDRIPVVFVHGTASSPARWAEMLNELVNDPAIAPHYQPWLFIYNTGNPIAYSGGLLVRSLRDLVARIDPDGRSEALRKTVVIGHSQGGLLTKLTAVDSGTRFWDNVSKKPVDQLDLAPETREILQRSMFYQPLPFVRRVVFISTPHRGSYLTRRSVSHLISRLVKAPFRLTGLSYDLLTKNRDELALRGLKRLPTSLDNMTPGHPFLQALSELPVDPHVTAHSIIPVKGDGPIDDGNDGVVEYRSAHIDGVESEKVIRFNHSVQGHPLAIAEVKRILLENVAAP
jgi:pimeloyl-ACP methyl ester carboxylesterase